MITKLLTEMHFSIIPAECKNMSESAEVKRMGTRSKGKQTNIIIHYNMIIYVFILHFQALISSCDLYVQK